MLMNWARPLFMVLVAWLIDRQKVTARQVAGMVVSFCGILVIMNRGDWSTLRDFDFNPGDLVILAGLPVWGVYSVMLRRRRRELDGLSFIFVLSVIGPPFLAPAYALESRRLRPPPLTLSPGGAALDVEL